VEQDREVARVLRDNLEHAGLADRARVVVAPVQAALERLPAEEPFDLVLIDPPYRAGLAEAALDALAARRLVARGGLVLVEHARVEPLHWPTALALELERPCGDSSVTLLRLAADAGESREVSSHDCP